MLKSRILCLSLFASLCSVCACDASQQSIPVSGHEFSVRELPIINGKKVTGHDHFSTVALVMNYGYGYQIFCTGTLITPNYVLTASHCISDCDDNHQSIEELRSYMRVAFGQAEGAFESIYEIDKFYPHPKFICQTYDIADDIAILKLKKSVPLSVAAPTLPLPPTFALTAEEVDSTAGIMTTTVGFGKTNARNEYSSGTKYETSRRVYSICPKEAKKSKRCSSHSYYTNASGFMFFDFANGNTGTCQGDSGGPTFVERNGYQFVAGVTSYGFGECNGYDGVTMVSDYYDFITKYVDDLANGEPEDCFNQVDDNGDGRFDCDDPYCFVQKQCIPEDCRNGRDDNGDGFTDCEDSACSGLKMCQPEDCTNGIDDNENGLIDCNEAFCFRQLICQPEICDDKIDNNGDGRIDCDDPKCQSEIFCQHEICDNNMDDNANGMVDCADPECAGALKCLPEICNNNIDDNGNGIVDCNELSCKTQVYCQPENCANGIDDNMNGLADCADPACIATLTCQPEICDDEIDNNANGLIDCDEESCSEFCQSSSSSGCSISSSRHSSPLAVILMVLCAMFGIVLRRREVR